MAWTWTFRVASSTTESTAVTFPMSSAGGPADPWALTRTPAPRSTRATSCCGIEKFT